ncbi:MAG: SDR family NAD(P)-dependent oxidoreductase [Ilumatobacteraceae bacterium]
MVVVSDIQEEAGRAVAESLGDMPGVRADRRDRRAQVAAAVDLAVATFGRLDVMFNNASIVGAVEPISETR